MAKQKKGLGRGLSNLIQEQPTITGSQKIAVTAVQPNPYQPRTNFDAQALETLAASIREHGLVQPIVVRRMGADYELVAGERRWRACQLLGMEEIDAIVKDYSTEQTSEIALVENLQREDLDPIEEAYAYERLRETFKVTQEDMAVRVGRSRSHIANMVRLLKLPHAIQNALSAGEIAVGVARPLLGLRSEKQQLEAFGHILEKEMNARQAEAYVKSLQTGRSNTVKPMPSYVDEAQLKVIHDRLKMTLGSPVALKFQPGDKVKGSIQITFGSEEELERLLSRLQELEREEGRDLGAPRDFIV